jgi:phosphoribosylaminoimidazole-succinocarboxamide synthase
MLDPDPPLDLVALDGVTRIGSGKVRELYAVGDDLLLLVASDRISAFDVVLPTEVPGKGQVLTGMSAFWFERLADLVPTHVVSTDPRTYGHGLERHAEALHARSMLCRRAEPLPIECVARGYLAGSGWQEYRTGGTVCGIPLPEGLRESDRLPEVLFTPATKAERGDHDENIDFDRPARSGPTIAAARPRTRSSAGSSWPTPSSSSAWWTASWS